MAINYAANKKYFKPLAWKPAAIIGVIGLVACAVSPIVGVIALAIAVAIIGVQMVGRSSAAAIDQQCLETVAGMKDKALKKLGLDEDQVTEIAPIFFDGYIYRNLWNPYFKKEDKWRSSNYESTAFFFSAEQVYYYSYTFSLTEDNKKESTEEYFYKDIVAAATASDTFKFKSGKDQKEESINYEFFKLTTSGGTSIAASFRDMESAERSINGMKQLLRQKKSAN